VKLGNTSKNDLLKIFSDRFSEIISGIERENMILLNKEQ